MVHALINYLIDMIADLVYLGWKYFPVVYIVVMVLLFLAMRHDHVR